MERIQSAIAKARAARESGAEAPHRHHQPLTDSGLAAIWSELDEVPLRPRQLEEARIIAHQPGPGAAAYDLMRTNLLRHLREHGWTRVAISSPGSGCGKTTVCLNLAFSLARQTDLRVLVLEMDLRRPAMSPMLGLTGKPNLAEVLEGKQTPERGLVRFGTNLAIGASTDPVPNPAELLSSAQAAATIDAIEARFKPDVILCDLPPVLVTDDTLAFLDQVDCALLVAAAGHSTVADIDRAGKELADNTRVLGVVLNKCRFVDRLDGYSDENY
ncbi:MAG: CpsD/CapB family tyrosine-protein kinase [Paracoccaceae bacterium]